MIAIESSLTTDDINVRLNISTNANTIPNFYINLCPYGLFMPQTKLLYFALISPKKTIKDDV